LIEKAQGCGHGRREELSALATTEHDEPERISSPRRDVGHVCGFQNRGTHRIAGRYGLCRVCPGRFGKKPASDRLHPRSQRLVGAAHHRILLVDDRRHAHAGRGHQWRDCWIATEADDRDRPQTRYQLARGAKTGPELPGSPRHRDRIFRSERRRRYDMNLISRKLASKTLGAAVGHQMHGKAPCFQLVTQCFRRKKMTAGSPGG